MSNIIRMGCVEVSLNGYEWFEKASVPITFLSPPKVIMSSFGTIRSKTPIQICKRISHWGAAGFMIQASGATENKRRHQAISPGFHYELHHIEATKRIQSVWRRYIVLCNTRGGKALPFTVVRFVVNARPSNVKHHSSYYRAK